MIVGVSDDVSVCLASDEDEFFGDDFDSGADSSVESVTTSPPPAKRPRLDDSWLRSSESECESENSATDDTTASSGSDSDESENNSATLQTTDSEIAAKFVGGCGCSENHFAGFSVADYKLLREQLKGASPQQRDSFLLGILSAGLIATAATHSGPRTR